MFVAGNVLLIKYANNVNADLFALRRLTPTSFHSSSLSTASGKEGKILNNSIPSLARGATACVMAGRGFCIRRVERRNPCLPFPGEVIAQAPAF